MSLAQKPIRFWRAHCCTEHYEFEGFGSTEAEAQAMLEKGFRAHGRQCGIGLNWWKQGYDWCTEELQLGACFRDRSLLTTLKK